MEVLNQQYDPAKSVAKGAKVAGTAATSGGLVGILLWAALGALRQKGSLPWDEEQDQVVMGLAVTGAASVVAGIRQWWSNRKKHRTKSVYTPRNSTGAVIAVLIGLGACLGGLSGCVTTTQPDGTRVRQIDPSAVDLAWEQYIRIQTERDRLAALQAEKDAAKEAARQERIAELERQAREIFDAILGNTLDGVPSHLGVTKGSS